MELNKKMTITEFKKTAFHGLMKVEYDGVEHNLMGVDFEEMLLAFNIDNDDALKWVRCENVKIVEQIKVTTKMQEARNYVDDFISKNGSAPSYFDIALALGLKSTSVSYHRLRGYRHRLRTRK